MTKPAAKKAKTRRSRTAADDAKDAVAKMISQGKGMRLAESLPALVASSRQTADAFSQVLRMYANERAKRPDTITQDEAIVLHEIHAGLMSSVNETEHTIVDLMLGAPPMSAGHGRIIEGELVDPIRDDMATALAVFEGYGATKQ